MITTARSLASVTLAALCTCVVAQPAKQGLPAFPGLRTHVIQDRVSQIPQQISFDPLLTKLLNEPLDAKYNTQGIDGIDMTRVLVTRLNRISQTRHYVYFDPGASNDPAFVLAEEASTKPIGTIDADQLVLPGNGFIYAIGRTNKLHLERRKFAVQDGKLEEVKQPFQFVGLESRANVAITITTSKDGTESVAFIPKGERLFVVLSDDQYLLIRTNFGLVGWFKTSGNRESPEIDGIYFDGD
ncbi:hypothetical protein [Rhodoferax sp.]|uniref:hypothetical protein n=1 Tax=Rhodoferax sp. TaxID=50421 RepID=UPI0025D17106|nr:hypothetical protein [Rhodoferax sp.]